MSDEDVFFYATTSDFTTKDTSPVDYESFLKFQKEQDEKFRKIEIERRVKERELNLTQWDNSLPHRWRGASLSRITLPAAQEALSVIRRKGRRSSFFITGASGSGKTFLSYAVIRKYIANGWTSLPGVKIISESSLLNLARTGFEGHSRFEKILDRKYDLYFIDDVGARREYREYETVMLENLIDHIYSRSLSAIFTSPYSTNNFANILGETSRAKFESLIEGGVLDLGHDTGGDDNPDRSWASDRKS